MIPPELPFYTGIGAVLALLVGSAFLPIPSRHRFALRALLIFVALLAVALVLPDPKHSVGGVVMTKAFFAVCGVTLVTGIRLLWVAWQAQHLKYRLLGAGLAALLLIIVLVLLPNFVRARVSIPNSACRANLRTIQGAKESWAIELKKNPTDVPQLSDLIGPDKYIRDNPVCPLGGTYRLGAIREKPTCSFGASNPGHNYDFKRR